MTSFVFFPLPQGQGSLRPIFGPTVIGACFWADGSWYSFSFGIPSSVLFALNLLKSVFVDALLLPHLLPKEYAHGIKIVPFYD